MRTELVAALLGGLVLIAPIGSAPAAQPAEAAGGCEWIAGDLHIHTTYSHDSYGGPLDDNTGLEEAYTFGHSVASQFAVAASRGLGFLAITDHNDIRSQEDAGFGSLGVIGIRGYEKSLRGHAQMLGAAKIYDAGDRSAAAIQTMAEQLRADGGVFQVNHPAEGSVDHPHDPDWRYGYEVVPDTVEVWNISRLWQPPAPSASSNDDAIRYWEGWLDRGHRVAATGGSDNHYLATTPIQGAGQPTTWVCATAPSEAGVLAGIRQGRTFISHQPPLYGGPQVFLEADADSDGTFESIVGDAVAPGSALRVRVLGAPGAQLRIVTDGGEAAPAVPVTAAAFAHAFSVPPDKTWVRAEIFHPDAQQERAALCDDVLGSQTTYCRNALLVLGMTSALYLGEPAPEPTTTVTYVGDISGRSGATATFAATLADAHGSALPGRDVTFTFRDSTYSATTDESGRASVAVRLQTGPGTYDIVSSFAGDADHDPSQDIDAFEVAPGR